MMRSGILVLSLAIAALAASGAVAGYQFGDTSVNWPGYSGMSQDENGVPIFLNSAAGVVEVNEANNQLLSVLFNYERGNLYTNLWKHLRPGDLMLDTDDVPGWDYIVRSPVAPVPSPCHPYQAVGGVLAAGQWTVYKFDTDIPLANSGQYMLAAYSKTRSGGNWPGSVRGYHPWAIDQDWLDAQLALGNAHDVGTIYFSGWQDPYAFTHESFDGTDDNAGQSIFDFTNGTFASLYLDSLTIGFTVSCANDVIYETIPLRTPTGEVPEPASLLIWSVLGLSFAGGSWRLAFRRRWTHWDGEE